MSLSRWERFLPLAGILAVALWIVGVFIVEGADRPEDGGTPQQYLDYISDDSNALLAGGFIFLLGTVLFMWFLGSLRARLYSAEGGVGHLASVAFAGGLGTAIMLLGLPAPEMVAALNDDEISGEAVEALTYVSELFFIGAELSAAVLVVATGLLAIATRALPRWLGWASLLLGLWLLIPPIGWAGLLFGLPLWTLVVSVLLWRPGATTAEAPATGR